MEHLDPAFALSLKLDDKSPWFPRDLDQALRVLGRDHPELASTLPSLNLPRGVKLYAMSAVAGGWASADPAAAMAWVQGLKLHQIDTEFLLSKVFTVWLPINREAAKQGLKAAGLDTPAFELYRRMGIRSQHLTLTNLLNPDDRSTEIGFSLTRDPFVDVAGLYEDLKASDLDWQTAGSVQSAINGRGWYSPDPASAAAAAEKLPEGKIRDFLLRSIADDWSAHDPAAALAFLEKNGLQRDFTSTVTDPKLTAAALADPQTTFSGFFASGEKMGNPRGEQVQSLVSEWAQSDPQTAVDWMLAEGLVPTQGPGTGTGGLLFSCIGIPLGGE